MQLNRAWSYTGVKHQTRQLTKCKHYTRLLDRFTVKTLYITVGQSLKIVQDSWTEPEQYTGQLNRLQTWCKTEDDDFKTELKHYKRQFRYTTVGGQSLNL